MKELTPNETTIVQNLLLDAKDKAVALMLAKNDDLTKRQAGECFYKLMIDFFGLNPSKE